MSDTKRWPRPDYDSRLQPHMFFLLTPPFSGSTAIAALLATSPRTMLLQSRGEGQWLVPGLCEDDRWDAAKEVDYEAVRATWLAAWQQRRAGDPDIDVVIEKSPPNIVRIGKLLELFPNHSLLVNNRDPYANCASILYRIHDGANLDRGRRRELLGMLAGHWRLRSLCLRELGATLNAPLLSYEDFCAEPAAILDRLALPEGVAEGIDLQAQVSVKDYPLQGIVNQNPRQIAQLDESEIEAVTAVLRTEEELLAAFGYQLR